MRYLAYDVLPYNRAKSIKMKSLVFLVFVLAFIGLAQPVLINMHRLRRVGFDEEKVADLTIMEELAKTTLKEKWYSKSLWFFNKIIKDMMKNVERNEYERLYK